MAALIALGAEPMVIDVFDAAKLTRAMQVARPQVVVHQLRDLPYAPGTPGFQAGLDRNARLRIEGTRNLVGAAKAAGVQRLIAQSIAFVYVQGTGARVESDPLDFSVEGASGRAVAAASALEQAVLTMPEGIALRYGYFYGPGGRGAPRGLYKAPTVTLCLQRKSSPLYEKIWLCRLFRPL